MEYRRLLILVLVLAPFCAPSAAVYKWVDEQGNVQYSQSPPPAGHEAKKLDVRTRGAGPSGEGESEMERLRREAGFGAGDQSEGGQGESEPAPALTPEQQAEREKMRRENCERARQNLKVLQTMRRVIMTDEEGNRTRLNEAQQQAQMEKAREDIQEFCS